MTKRFWMRWHSLYDPSSFEYHGPWWISGYTPDDLPIFCAAVCAEDSDAAREVIRQSYDYPHDIEFSFVEERPAAWEPFSGRFPRANWMTWPMPSGSTGRTDRQ